MTAVARSGAFLTRDRGRFLAGPSTERILGVPRPRDLLPPHLTYRSLAALAAILVAPWAGTVASPAAEIRFSHRVHLQAGAVCASCHSAAAASTSATDSNLPTERECNVCHGGGAVRPVDTAAVAEIPTAKRSYRFNHKFHLTLGNVTPVLAAAIDGGTYLGKSDGIRERLGDANACAACHRGLEETDLAGKANLPQMSDCLVCHSEIDNPFTCEKCHLEGVELRPADHTRTFVDQHSTGKIQLDKASCLPCHGTNFACMGCH